ncbi:putative nuclease HARBI1 like protein [Argiope bruennichi]|uniref:Putative nuclease HARBI1 like protein n=1 Tax=Argiope bruennichi TaxID=94029 RepID=A0A8T0FF95_ARGBR|nr:putative nuclease HARBI1 like protein [Argiope bruennichi]
MSATDFESLFGKNWKTYCKEKYQHERDYSDSEVLAFTLRFFATGDSYASLSYLFKFSKQTISKCIDDVCKAIIQELKEEIKLPENEDEWLCIAQQFENQWNFPNCLGAIDGKHVVIQCPNNTSTEFFNYKGTFSVVLLALVDARYCFTFVDIGCQGRISDGGVFNNSVLLTKLKMEQLKLPHNRKLQPLGKNLPYVFLGDSAFALSRHMMKPYPGNFEKGSTERIFNYRLSRASRVVENVFGIMASVFRVFRKPMALQPDKVSDVTLACVLLHNFMRKSASSTSSYSPPGTFDTEADGEVVPGSWRNDQSGMTSFMPLKKAPRKSGQGTKATRNCFAEYFSTSGKLSWQDKYC